MAHAKESDLGGLDFLLKEIRKDLVLNERTLERFYLKGKGALATVSI